jgi:hypothetical protein
LIDWLMTSMCGPQIGRALLVTAIFAWDNEKCERLFQWHKGNQGWHQWPWSPWPWSNSSLECISQSILSNKRNCAW